MAEISDEAVRAALDAFWWEPADAESTMRAALTAALPFLEAAIREDQREKVKALRDRSDPSRSDYADGYYQACVDVLKILPTAAIRQGGKE